MNQSVSQTTTTDIPLVESDAEVTQACIPDYMQEIYHWAYLNSRNVWLLDHEWVVNSILWGHSRQLRSAVLSEIEPASRVFQAAHVYGCMQPELAQKIGPKGHLDVVDVVPLQVGICRRKLSLFPNADVRIADAASSDGRQYQRVVSYFLLHEIPDVHKYAVVAALLARLAKGGKAVFIDYHRPARWHPLGGLMRLVFRTLEPFATSLINSEISDYAPHGADFDWSKQTYFGGLYQKVVAHRR